MYVCDVDGWMDHNLVTAAWCNAGMRIGSMPKWTRPLVNGANSFLSMNYYYADVWEPTSSHCHWVRLFYVQLTLWTIFCSIIMLVPPFFIPDRLATYVFGLYQWLNSAGRDRNGVPPPLSGVPPLEIAVPPPKVVVPPPGNDVTSPFGGNSLKLLPPEVRF